MSNQINLPNLKDAIKGGLEGITNGAANIISKLKADPTKVAEAEAELEKLRIQAATEAERIGVQLEEIDAKKLESVNQTMREESKSEHFMQWSWRPMIGYTFCAVLINNYILLPYFKNKGMEVIEIPDNVWSAILVILGAASATRGLTKWQKEKK